MQKLCVLHKIFTNYAKIMQNTKFYYDDNVI